MTDPTTPTPGTVPHPVAQPHVTGCPDCGFETVTWGTPPPDRCPRCGASELDTRKGHAPMPDRPVYRCPNCDSVYHEPAERCARCGGPSPVLYEDGDRGEGSAATSEAVGVPASPPPPPTQPAVTPRPAGSRRPGPATTRRSK